MPVALAAPPPGPAPVMPGRQHLVLPAAAAQIPPDGGERPSTVSVWLLPPTSGTGHYVSRSPTSPPPTNWRSTPASSSPDSPAAARAAELGASGFSPPGTPAAAEAVANGSGDPDGLPSTSSSVWPLRPWRRTWPPRRPQPAGFLAEEDHREVERPPPPASTLRRESPRRRSTP